MAILSGIAVWTARVKALSGPISHRLIARHQPSDALKSENIAGDFAD